MVRIFLATEADEGLGHVAPWSGFVAQALERGYEVHMAAPDVGLLYASIGKQHDIPLWSSPSVVRSTQRQQNSAKAVRSWPELLVSLGYAQAHALLGAVSAWRSILMRVQPQVVVADYAPALLLAAKTLSIPSLEVGGGFCVPPMQPEFCNFPGISSNNRQAIQDADTQLTAAINACLAQFNMRGIASARDMQSWPVSRVVLSPAELDPYGPRHDVVYAGLLTPDVRNPAVTLPNQPWPPIVGYLKANTPGLEILLDEIEQSGHDALIYVAGLHDTSLPRYRHVQLTEQPFALADALLQADFYVSNGGLHGLGQALESGCWPVVVPQQAEQIATARNLVQRAWGSLWLAKPAQNALRVNTELFTPRPRQPRFAGHPSAQSTLFGLIDRIG